MNYHIEMTEDGVKEEINFKNIPKEMPLAPLDSL